MNKKYTSMFASAVVSAAFMVLPAMASASVVYNAVPNPLAPNYPSQPFQAQQTSEFGDYVHLGGTDRQLATVTVTMDNWALQATPANVTFCAASGANCDATGYFWPITVNMYSNHLNASDVPDTLLATKTETVHIPWRPVANATCTDTTQWKASDGNCYNGIAANATIDMSSLNVTLPDDVIVGFVYNTQSYGPNPTGVDGPYNSLNIAVPPSDPVTVGTDDSADRVFWNTSTISDYTNPVCTGGTFCEDTNWGLYGTVAMQINAVTPTGSINITKYACPDGTTVTRAANGVGLSVPAGCVPDTGKTFGYVHGTQTDANAPFPELSTPLTAGGTTNGSGVLTIPNLPATGRYLVVETNGSNQQLAAGDILGLYCQGDGDTSGNNDNQELTFVAAGQTVQCVAYDKVPPTFNVVVNKYIDGLQATAGSANSSSFPMVSTTTASNVNNGVETGGNAYTLDVNDAYHATTTDMASGASYATREVIGGNVVGADCTTGQPYAIVGYTSGATFADAVAAVATTTIPNFSNLTQNEYVIVWNKTCSAVTTNPATAVTLTDATLNGANGGSAATGHSFWVSLAPFVTTSSSIPSGVYSTPDFGAIAANTAFSALLSSLTTTGVPSNLPAVTPNTQYYFAAWSLVGGTWYPGAVLSFMTASTTPSPTPPANACATPTVAPIGYTLRNGASGNASVTLAPSTMFVGKNGNGKITGPDGNYILCLGNGNATVTLGNGSNIIVAGNGNQTITTGTGNQTITTGNGNSAITAGVGTDAITTGNGNSHINAGGGSSVCHVGHGNTTVTGCTL